LAAAVLVILALTPWCIATLPAVVALPLSVGTSGLAMLGFWHIGWLGGQRAIHRAIWSTEGDWRLVDMAARTWPAALLGSSVVTGSVVWLRFDSEMGQRHLLLVGPGADPDLFRRVVARLRLAWNQAPQGSANP
jgi:hypothetical protein